MAGFLSCYASVVEVLEEVSYDLIPTPGAQGLERRDAVFLWRGLQLLHCVGLCFLLYVGGGALNDSFPGVLFWFSASLGVVLVVQLVIEFSLIWNKKLRYFRAVLWWYDIAHDIVVFEVLAYLVLILVGIIVEYTGGGSALQVALQLGADGEVAQLLGSAQALRLAAVVGALLCALLVASGNHTAHLVAGLYAPAREGPTGQGKPLEARIGPGTASPRAAPGAEGRSNGAGAATAPREDVSSSAEVPEALSAATLRALGGFLRLSQKLISGRGGWLFSAVSLAARVVQFGLGLYAHEVALRLAAIGPAVLTYSLIRWASLAIACSSGLFLLADALGIGVAACRGGGSGEAAARPSSALRAYAVSRGVYDIVFLNITNVTSAFGLGVSSVSCMLGLDCLLIGSASGAMFLVSFSFYVSAVQSWNAMHETLPAAPPCREKEPTSKA